MDFNFNEINTNALIARGLQVLLIIIVVKILLYLAKRGIHKTVSLRIQHLRAETADELAKRTDTLSAVLTGAVTVVAWVIAAVMILSEFGVNIAPLIAAIGIVSLAFGFAAQNVIRDYLNGFFIVLEDWYRVGEVVNIAGNGGIVETITLRRTVLRQVNGTLHVVPNSQISMASNLTRDWSRIDLTVTVAYKENLDRVFAVINEICQQLKDDPAWGENLLTTPTALRVASLGDNGVDIVVRGDTKPMQQWGLTGELNRRIKNRFDAEGIEIPWPHTMVYFGNAPKNETAQPD